MADVGRSRRTNASRAGNAKAALEKLRAQRESGTKHAIAFEVREEAAIFDAVQEDEYAGLVAKRREEAGESPQSLLDCIALQCHFQHRELCTSQIGS